MIPIRCTPTIIEQTLTAIKAGGQRSVEVLVLWLGKRDGDSAIVHEAHIPLQHAAIDQFYVPPDAMKAVMQRLRERRLHICAQVHSHPGRAYHSEADDTWAIPQHVGAGSFVVPTFGRGVTTANFLTACAVYALTETNGWAAVQAADVPHFVRIDHADP